MAAAAAAAATKQALTAMQTSNLQLMQNLNLGEKKPSLPAFYQKNIDIWIWRVESAKKFSYLEEKIAVDLDPKINSYLFGDATEEKWKELLSYLRKQYGQTNRQQASKVIKGV